MAMLTAYFDESESDQQFVLAGFLSTAQKWNRFGREWKKILKEFGIPYFHAKEYAHCKRPFEGWSDWKRRQLAGRLCFTCKAYAEYSFSSSVNQKEYAYILTPKYRRLQNEYFFSFRNCMALILNFLKEKNLLSNHEQISFVFDNHGQFANHALRIYNRFMSSEVDIPELERKFLGPLSFADDKNVPPLQAADLLAYEINKNRRGFRRRLGLGLAEIPGRHIHWNCSKLSGYYQMLKRELPL